MHEIVLTGLDGGNLLGFLAALGAAGVDAGRTQRRSANEVGRTGILDAGGAVTRGATAEEYSGCWSSGCAGRLRSMRRGRSGMISR